MDARRGVDGGAPAASDNDPVTPQANSPCVQVCALGGGICIACKRTTDEIMRWGRMSAQDRERVLDRIFDGPARFN
ncbi:putative Fe-S protein YdhL (DUF1289 family) [Natronocella acetinitrilica]|uniref:Fe-S protein YdhL (DUF1289 family) n=1 Tax=Natronocella acetinitrilica TaxID=414046 RepID=A0AAE3G618_9GAMM|nr:putative Fe-S protein YdhL (DUF1289 family) [Natronocella acetinitrilica]